MTDPNNLATIYTINGHGETLSQASPDTGATAFTYDAASNVKTKLDARGIQATYSYDALNRLTTITYPDETVTYAYDSCANGVGRLCTVTDNSGSTTYTYNVHGRVATKTQAMGAVSKTLTYGYNAAGQLSSITLPSGKVVTYGYANNRPVSVLVDGAAVLDSVVYEPFGPNGGWRWGNSTPTNPNTHTRVLDKDYRVTRVTSDLPASGTQPALDRQLAWDNQSRVQTLTDLANSGLNATYGYDALDRLTSASQGTNTWGYTYNGTGDRLTSTANSATTTYGYLAGSHKLQALSGARTVTYSVDAAGNMTSDGTTTWSYGGNNRPTQAGTTTFAINALGQRVKKSSPNSTTYFLYDEAGRLAGEYDATGAAIQETVWLEDLPVATLRAAVNYVHPDHLGTPRAITRASDNALVWRWDNAEPFGDSAANEDPSGLGAFAYNLRFPGQYFDAETGLHYNYFRDYDPAIGRYVQADPLGVAGLAKPFLPTPINPADELLAEASPEFALFNAVDDPQSEILFADASPATGVSLFSYVGGRPLGLIDPMGLVASKPGYGACLKACNDDKDRRFRICRWCGRFSKMCIAWANAKHAICKADCTAKLYPAPPKQDPPKK